MCDAKTDVCSFNWKHDQKQLIPHFSYCTKLSREIQRAIPQELTLSMVRSLVTMCGEPSCLWNVLQDLIGPQTAQSKPERYDRTRSRH
jgi:hypothetical protein